MTSQEKVKVLKWYDDPVYIKMCEEAVEIQRYKFPTGYSTQFCGPYRDLAPVPTPHLIDDNSLYGISPYQPGDVFWCRYSQGSSGYWNPDLIWLPRQEDLQEMVRGTKHMHLLAHEFSMWCHGGEEFGRQIAAHNTGVDGDNSMEQLWLAFVMKENHGKVWSGSEWVKGE